MNILQFSGPLRQTFDLSRVNVYTSVTCHPAQDIDGILFEDTFGGFEEVRALFHSVQEGMNDLFMEFSSSFIASCGYQPVVHVISQVLRVSLKQFCEVSMHCPLEEWRGIAEAKIHDPGNIGAKGGLEGSSMLIFFGNTYVVIPPPDIEF